MRDDLAMRRQGLVEELRADGIRDERVLAAIGQVPREAFLPDDQREVAYRNEALPIGEGQTISQPFVVALMSQELCLGGNELVLEIGTGSGYQTAILAELAGQIVSVERHQSLLDRARLVLDAIGYRSVELHLTNGSLGWPAKAPYERIIVTAAAPDVPTPLLEQLGPNGRLVIPVGPPRNQELVLVTRSDGELDRHVLGPVRFVPLVGRAGWDPDRDPE